MTFNYQTTRGWPLQDKLEFHSIPEPNSGCILWMGNHWQGYGTLRWKGKMRRATHLAWELKRGPVPAGKFLCHKCDVRFCINPDHLFLGTQKDNIADMIRKGRRGDTRGHVNGNATLARTQVTEIKESMEMGKILAPRYGVSESQISRIKSGKRWC